MNNIHLTKNGFPKINQLITTTGQSLYLSEILKTEDEKEAFSENFAKDNNEYKNLTDESLYLPEFTEQANTGLALALTNSGEKYFENYLSKRASESTLANNFQDKKLMVGNVSLPLMPADKEFINFLVYTSMYHQAKTGKPYIKSTTEQEIILNAEGNAWFKRMYFNQPSDKTKIDAVPLIEWENENKQLYVDEDGEIQQKHWVQKKGQRIIENNVWGSMSPAEHSDDYKNILLAQDNNLEINPKTHTPRPLDELTRMYHKKHLLE